MDDNDTQTKVEAAKAKAEAAKAEYEAAATEARAVAKYETAKAKAEAAKEGNEYKEWLEYWDKRTGLNYNEEKHGTDYSGGWRKVQHQWQKLSDDCYVNDYGPTWFGKEPRYVEDYYVERKKFSRFLLGIRASFFEDKFFSSNIVFISLWIEFKIPTLESILSIIYVIIREHFLFFTLISTLGIINLPLGIPCHGILEFCFKLKAVAP